jgi:signal transduction histidine kinase
MNNNLHSEEASPETEYTRISTEKLASLYKYASLGRLVGAIVHEIRNPLHVLSILVDTLDRQIGNDPRASESLKNARISVQRISRIVTSTLETARAGIGEQRVDIRDILEHTLPLIEATTTGKEITFRREIQGQTAPPILIDPDVIQQVVVNLLVNAAEAVGTKGAVTVRLSWDTQQVQFAVTDSGEGIPSDVLPHVFDPFFTTKPQGTGLGLAITRDLVQRAGGTVEAQSPPGEGATFIVRFPVAE